MRGAVQASDVKAQLGFAKSYTLSADDISRIVQQRKAKGLLKKPLNTQRVELLMRKRAAEEAGDEATLERCCARGSQMMGVCMLL
jgi:hypothetical protein